MIARRRPFATLLAAMLVWLTGVSWPSAPRAQERRLIVGNETISAVTSAIPRPNLVVAREITRLPALPDNHAAILPSIAPAPTSSVRTFVEREIDTSVRRAQRIGSAYDAMAPPVMVAARS